MQSVKNSISPVVFRYLAVAEGAFACQRSTSPLRRDTRCESFRPRLPIRRTHASGHSIRQTTNSCRPGTTSAALDAFVRPALPAAHRWRTHPEHNTGSQSTRDANTLRRSPSGIGASTPLCDAVFGRLDRSGEAKFFFELIHLALQHAFQSIPRKITTACNCQRRPLVHDTPP